jgi:hypothetical protein
MNLEMHNFGATIARKKFLHLQNGEKETRR